MTQQPMEQLLNRLAVLVQHDEELAPLLVASGPGYFGPAHGAFAPDAAALRRHLEWFLCESAGPGGPTLDLVRERVGAAAGLDDEGCYRALRDSHTGVFEVTSIKPGEGFWLRDLGSLGEYPVRETEASRLVQAGDVVAGRLFPLGNGDHALSRSAIVRRAPNLAKALRADLEEARKLRRGVVRIGGSEIESMFAAASDKASGDPVAAARKLLHQAGLAPVDAERWLEELAQAPFDPQRLVHGADDALAPLLDALAFDTGADLDEARRVLIAAWHALAAEGPGRGKSLQPAAGAAAMEPRRTADVETALSRFEQGTREGRPLAQMLDELERELDLAGEPDEDELAPAPDFPGVVGAMVVEFLWETAQEHGPGQAAELRILETLGESARDVGVFENLAPRDLARFAGVHAIERGIARTAGEAQQLVAALRKFCRWAREVHEVDMGAEGEALLKRLESELPRVAEANARRTRQAEGGDYAELLHLEADGRADVHLEGATRNVRIDMTLVPWLKPGDRLRSRIDDEGRLAVYAVHPNFR